MSALTLLPGYGVVYTSESVANTIGADILDTTRCPSFAAQVTAITGAPTIQLEMTLDLTNWASLGSPITAALGSISRFALTGGPYGKIRINASGVGTAVTLTIIGFGM